MIIQKKSYFDKIKWEHSKKKFDEFEGVVSNLKVAFNYWSSDFQIFN